MSEVHVTVDDRVRLVTAVLAASHWPEQEQAQTPHAVHSHAKQTRQFVANFQHQKAVAHVNQALEDGLPLTDLFAGAVRCRWPDFAPKEALPTSLPPTYPAALATFVAETAIGDFWVNHTAVWFQAQSDLTDIFQNSHLLSFLNKLGKQPFTKEILMMPNIVYPMLRPVLAETETSLYFILPPAKAWGESPPWPFGEDPGWVIAQTCWYLATYVMADVLVHLRPTAQALLKHAIVTLCLEENFDAFEGQGYMVRIKREHTLPQLPAIVKQLRAFLADSDNRTLSILQLE